MSSKLKTKLLNLVWNKRYIKQMIPGKNDWPQLLTYNPRQGNRALHSLFWNIYICFDTYTGPQCSSLLFCACLTLVFFFSAAWAFKGLSLLDHSKNQNPRDWLPCQDKTERGESKSSGFSELLLSYASPRLLAWCMPQLVVFSNLLTIIFYDYDSSFCSLNRK